ncbi:MAG: ABC transporter ATP-binding protein [Actinobacteria bacterium]|nr:ABC transporter ATP-binding protein [Actinomycetota bacterium]
MRLELVDLAVGYKDHVVLRDLDLEVPVGSICALLGPNGSGKTTLLRNVNAILKPLGGKVLLEKREVQSMSRKEIALSMAFVPQSTNLPFNYTGLDMVVMGKAPHMSVWSSPGPRARDEAWEVMASLGIDQLADQYYMQMSAGERQLVLLARAVMQDARMLLLDEPTSHLDLRNQVVIMDMVRKIAHGKKATAIITLHDPNLALRYCDYAALLCNGVMLDHGPVDEMLSGENLSKVYGMEVKCELTEGGTRVVVPTADVRLRPDPVHDNTDRNGKTDDEMNA